MLVCLVIPAISPQVMDQAQDEDNDAFFACQATGEPVPIITWYFNDIPVDESNTMKYTIEMTSLNTTTINNTLTIMSVESSDVGTYTCNATNVVSTDTSSGVLTVNGKNACIYVDSDQKSQASLNVHWFIPLNTDNIIMQCLHVLQNFAAR